MGYATKESIGEIKKSAIPSIEAEYLKIIKSSDCSHVHSRFPELKMVTSFSPGLKATLISILELFKTKKNAAQVTVDVGNGNQNEAILKQTRNVNNSILKSTYRFG